MELDVLLVNIIAVVAIVGGLIIAGWWVIGLYAMHTRESEKELPEVELPSNLHEVFTGVPPVLVIFISFILIFGVGYVFWVWWTGVTY